MKSRGLLCREIAGLVTLLLFFFSFNFLFNFWLFHFVQPLFGGHSIVTGVLSLYLFVGLFFVSGVIEKVPGRFSLNLINQ